MRLDTSQGSGFRWFGCCIVFGKFVFKIAGWLTGCTAIPTLSVPSRVSERDEVRSVVEPELLELSKRGDLNWFMSGFEWNFKAAGQG